MQLARDFLAIFSKNPKYLEPRVQIQPRSIQKQIIRRLAAPSEADIAQRRDLAFLVLAGLFLGTMGMLNILGLTRFLTLGTIGQWPIVVGDRRAALSDHLSLHRPHQ